MRDSVNLYTQFGEIVDSVSLTCERWELPDVILYKDRMFLYNNGRYNECTFIKIEEGQPVE